ncbi:hypothetical protein [Brevundimonas denitrificans]|uniref:hypothetical protein n=1 Tax=Brevundimonas denitrificans TaxID=1443434 RepID=UPI00223AE2D3|nr:hypothetical protein [Brevundimonas denitrificans]
MDDHGRDPAHWPSAQDRAEIDAAFFNDAPSRDAARGGYRRASDEVWDLARQDYQAGDTAADVCARYGLKVSTLRDRAASGGWRRLDTPHAAPDPVDLDSDEARDPARLSGNGPHGPDPHEPRPAGRPRGGGRVVDASA